MMHHAMVTISGLTHCFGDRKALDHLTLDIQTRQLFGVLGPNGSGKTTLFRILSTLFHPTFGEISIAGLDLGRDLKKIREKIGVVFQSPSLDGKLTVRENLIHQGHLYGLAGNALGERCREMLQRMGLLDRQGDRVEVLSGGLKRRVEIAKGLLHRPELLILDEPSTGLDPGARLDLWRYLKQLRDTDGVTILVTTHLMEEAEHCDRIAILNKGCLVKAGSPAELKAALGGEVIQVCASETAELVQAVRERFGLEAQVTRDGLQLEHPEGHRFVPDLIEAFPGKIESVMVRKPTLEDVFVHETGYTFWSGRETN